MIITAASKQASDVTKPLELTVLLIENDANLTRDVSWYSALGKVIK